MKALYTNWGFDYWILDKGKDEIQLPLWNVIGWSPSSIHFAAYTNNNSQIENLALFDAEGNLQEVLIDIPDNTYINFLSGKLWAPNENYLLFTTDHFYMADIENWQVVDLCISSDALRSVVWSPNGTQFALTTYDRDDGIQIFDPEKGERYVVGYHDGDIIGWRTDD